MIAYQRGRLRARPIAGDSVEVATDEGPLLARVVSGTADLDVDRPVLVARTKVDVGVSTREIVVLLGSWSGANDPAGPLGLASTPVVVTVDDSLAPLVEAGARRSGRVPAVAHVTGAEISLGLRLFESVRAGAGVIVIGDGTVRHLWLARALGGRPLTALPLQHPDALASLFEGLDLDVEVPVPACAEPMRDHVRSLLAPLALERTHHLVEVDPRPAFDELGLDVADADLDRLAAAAAGVLAGRLAVGNRRWQRELEV
jgi:hypothetical protein